MRHEILIVDDSPTVRRAVRDALGPLDASLFEAENGAAALTLIKARPSLSLVLCDVNMPVMGGIELLRTLGATSIPFLMLTTESQPRNMSRARELGAKGWIIKPFNGAELLAATKRLAGIA